MMVSLFDMPRYMRGKSKMAAAKSLGERVEAGEDMKQSKFRTVEDAVAWADDPRTQAAYATMAKPEAPHPTAGERP